MFPCLFNLYMHVVMKEVKMGMGWRGDYLASYMQMTCLCVEEEDLRVMVGQLVEVHRGKGLKVNAGKSKVMVMNGEEGLDCEVLLDGIRFEHVLEFKY